jgi:hypothetical protein
MCFQPLNLLFQHSYTNSNSVQRIQHSAYLGMIVEHECIVAQNACPYGRILKISDLTQIQILTNSEYDTIVHVLHKCAPVQEDTIH